MLFDLSREHAHWVIRVLCHITHVCELQKYWLWEYRETLMNENFTTKESTDSEEPSIFKTERVKHLILGIQWVA